MAHTGGQSKTSAAFQVATWHANVFLEPTWMGGFHIRHWARQVGSKRVHFGPDHADVAATELTKLRTLGMTEADLAVVLGGTARQVFGLEVGDG